MAKMRESNCAFNRICLYVCLLLVILLPMRANAEIQAGNKSANRMEDVTSIDDHAPVSKENDLDESANNCMDIAKYDWGTSKDVIKSENVSDGMVAGINYGEFDNELVFDTVLLDYHMGVHYEFDQDGALISTMFVMVENDSDEEYVKTFLKLLDAYNEEFGEYVFVTDASKLDSIIDDPTSYATDIAKKGDVQVQWTGTSDDSTLALRLSGMRGYADVIVMYTCPGYYK